MKIQLLLLACFVTVTIARGAQRSCDELKARLSSELLDLKRESPTGLLPSALSVRSCDLDDDGALNSLEFADCLQRMTDDQSERSADTHQQRADCFQRFMKEADQDLDDLVSSAELGRWSARLDSSVSSGADASLLAGRFTAALYLCHQSKCYSCDKYSSCRSNGACSNGNLCIQQTCCEEWYGTCSTSRDCYMDY